MLGVCGSKADVPMLEAMIVSDFDAMKPVLDANGRCGQSLGGPGRPADVWIEAVQQEERRKKLGLDALVACYLILRGPDGLDLVDNRFLKNPHAEYTHIYSTIMALRFHGDENGRRCRASGCWPRCGCCFDNPDFADQVILDLSRWEDWSVLDRLGRDVQERRRKGLRPPAGGELPDRRERAAGRRRHAGQGGAGGVGKARSGRREAARSLMAFGFLARARDAKPVATGATRPAAAAKTVPTPEGFAAGAADEARENADPSDIPDPASFGQSTKETAPAANEVADEAVEQQAKEPATAHEVEPLPVSAAYSRPVVIGVPLASVLVLVTVYWLILRWGAM